MIEYTVMDSLTNSKLNNKGPTNGGEKRSDAEGACQQRITWHY